MRDVTVYVKFRLSSLLNLRIQFRIPSNNLEDLSTRYSSV